MVGGIDGYRVPRADEHAAPSTDPRRGARELHDQSKKLALILVLSAHAAAAVLVERSLKQQHVRRPENEQPPLLVTFLTLISPPPPPAPRSGPSPRRPREPIPVPPPEPPVSAPAPDSSTAITDFRAQAADAARDVASGARPKAFGHEFAPAAERPEVGVFGPKNDHPAGTVEQLPGVERHWVTDQCYFDIERLPVPKEMPGPKTMTRFCVRPGTAGADMFKGQRPAYMTAPQPPREKQQPDQP